MRPSGRAPDEMRAITIETGFTRHAEGSVLIGFGDTKVLCTASVERGVPPWLRGKGEGWVTGEYSMLPRATHTRGGREAAKGKQSGRTQEIQRLIGRSLRAVVDLQKLGERQITLDCDVIQADGGTRTAAISGAWIALRLAVNGLMASGDIKHDPIAAQVAAAVSDAGEVPKGASLVCQCSSAAALPERSRSTKPSNGASSGSDGPPRPGVRPRRGPAPSTGRRPPWRSRPVHLNSKSM